MSTNATTVIFQWRDLLQNFPFDLDNRKLIWYWEVPLFDVKIGIIPLDFGFWISTFGLLSLQTIINIAIALFMYFYILQTPLHEKTILNENGETYGNVQSNLTRCILGYGVLVPFLLVTPFVIATYWEFHNLALLLCLCGAIPNLLTLRVIEAVHDLLPDFVLISPPRHTAPKEDNISFAESKKKTDLQHTESIGYNSVALTAINQEASPRTYSLPRLILYFSATLQIQFDPKTGEPILFTWSIFKQKFLRFILVFSQTSLLYSLLLAYDYGVFPRSSSCTLSLEESGSIASSFGRCLADFFHWGNLANNLLMASLTSLVLDGGASGLGLLTSLVSGYTLEPFSNAPLTMSKSPSDFWGNRWNRPVESSLRRGCYRPLRLIGGYSRGVAAFSTFVLSGLIHEYVLWIFTLRQGIPNHRRWYLEDSGHGATDNDNNHQSSFLQSYIQPAMGHQFLFFAWNAMVVMLERRLARHWLFCRMQEKLPQPIQTFLVLLTVLPISHLFTDEYIRSGFYGDAAWAFPVFLVLPK